jgi:ubiquinone/menaquinone biosynthesis C-methylase UbiE
MNERKLFTRRIYEDWMGDVQRKKIAGILKRIEISKDARVLDVGSGPGFLSDFINGIVTLDVEEENIKNLKGAWVLASGDKLPFVDSSFDIIFCLDTIHLLSGVGEFARVINEGGRAVVTKYCNEYNKTEKMKELKELFYGWELLDEFFVGPSDKEMDAVVVCRAP